MKNAQTSAFTIDSTESITAPFNWNALVGGIDSGLALGLLLGGCLC